MAGSQVVGSQVVGLQVGGSQMDGSQVGGSQVGGSQVVFPIDLRSINFGCFDGWGASVDLWTGQVGKFSGTGGIPVTEFEEQSRQWVVIAGQRIPTSVC